MLHFEIRRLRDVVCATSRGEERGICWGGGPAENECAHGRLPFDPSLPCGCFPEEGHPDMYRLSAGSLANDES